MKYDDILSCPRPTPLRERMGKNERSAQFLPFAALQGYEDALEDKALLRIEHPDFAEDEKERLTRQIALLSSLRYPKVEVTYWEKGFLLTYQGILKKVDEVGRLLRFQEGKNIPLEDVFSLSGDFED